jgi:hypothetical protein
MIEIILIASDYQDPKLNCMLNESAITVPHLDKTHPGANIFLIPTHSPIKKK